MYLSLKKNSSLLKYISMRVHKWSSDTVLQVCSGGSERSSGQSRAHRAVRRGPRCVIDVFVIAGDRPAISNCAAAATLADVGPGGNLPGHCRPHVSVGISLAV